MKTLHMTTRKSALLLVALYTWPQPVAAQVSQPPNPCEAKEFHDFDFWIGKWDVYNTANNKRVGTNVISPIEAHCALLESWQSINGGTGTSLNLFNPHSSSWRQLWIARGYQIDIIGGLNAEGTMVLEGAIHYYNGKTKAFKGRWTPLANGDVKQHFQEFNADKNIWSDWFIGTYKKQQETE